MSASTVRMSAAKPQRSIDKIAALRRTELFASVSEAVVAEAASRAITRQLEGGEVLFSEQEKASGLYIVVEGELRSVRQNSKGREQVLSTERAGAILAAAAVFNGGKFYCTTIADSPSQVLYISTPDIHHLCREHPDLLWAVAKIFAHKVRHYAELIETLALRNVDQRVAQHIFTLCREQGTSESDTCSVEISMTQAEMASRLGSTREVVCRSIAHLEQRGLIQAQGTRLLKVVSLRALSNFAGLEQQLDEPRAIAEISTEIA